MERGTYLQLMRHLDAAAAALLAMILKLEKDGHIRSGDGPYLSAVLLPELMAYCCSLQRKSGRREEEMLTYLLPFLYLQEADAQLVREGIRRRCRDFEVDEELLPGAFVALCHFDAMAQEYEAAFYTRMRTDNPGCLAGYYVELFCGLWLLGGGDPREEPFLQAVERLEDELPTAQPGR